MNTLAVTLMNPIPYFGSKIQSIPVYPRIWEDCESEVKANIAWARELDMDIDRQLTMSSMTIDMMNECLNESVDNQIRHLYCYRYMRVNMTEGSLVVDPTARRKWVELGGKLDN